MIFQTVLLLFAPLWIARFFKLWSKISFKRPSLPALLFVGSYILWNLYNILSAFRSDVFFLTNTSTNSPSFILKRNYRLYTEKIGHDFLEFDLLLEKIPEHHSKIPEFLDSFGVKALKGCFACYSHSHYILFHLYNTFLDYFYFLILIGILTLNYKSNARLFALLPAGCFLALETLWITLGDKSIDLLYFFFEHDTISHFTLNQLAISIIYTATALVLLFLKFGEDNADSNIKVITELSRTIVFQLRQLNKIQIVHQDSKDNVRT